MTPNEYLRKILDQQTFDTDEQELVDLRARRDAIKDLLKEAFSDSKPSTRQAGSLAKGTMIRESYDVDLTCYFDHGEVDAGKTLKELYEAVEEALRGSYSVERKASAIRIRDFTDWSNDLHVDVVPGRFISDDKTDVNLHRTTPEKGSLKTNLQTHVDHIKGSGVVPTIRLAKLWKVKNGIVSAKTFVLELLVVKLLARKTGLGLADQLKHVWTEMRDNAATLSVEDPANSNNDLSEALDACRFFLSSAASTALWQVENNGWDAIFGPVEDDEEQAGRGNALKAAAAAVVTPTKPYCER